MLVLVGHRLKVQDSTSSIPLSAVIATNQVVACVLYEVVQEALHEVRISLPISCPSHHTPRAVHRLLSCSSGCYSLRRGAAFSLRSLLILCLVFSAFWCIELEFILVMVLKCYRGLFPSLIPAYLHHDSGWPNIT
jgi:hypothetical protein